MHPTKRNCYYENEKDLDFFPVYSEPNCALECAWKQARDICDCVPWFLMRSFKHAAMCESYGNMCFKEIIDTRYNDDFGDLLCMDSCLQDCNEYSYSVALSKSTYKSSY